MRLWSLMLSMKDALKIESSAEEKKEERKEKEKGQKDMGLISAMTYCSSEDRVICTDKKGKRKKMKKKKKREKKGEKR